MYVCACVCVYIYTQRERERDRDRESERERVNLIITHVLTYLCKIVSCDPEILNCRIQPVKQ